MTFQVDESAAAHGRERLNLSTSIMRCPICNNPLTACFNEDSRVGWAECFAGGHHFVQNIFTPESRGSEKGYCLIEVDP